MSLLFVVGIYFFARGVFALYQQPIFYTKRALEHIDPADLPAYLKEVGKWYMAVGFICTGKAILNVPYPDSKLILGVYCVLLFVCVVFLSKANDKYMK